MRSLLSIITVACFLVGASRSAQIPNRRELDIRAKSNGRMTDSAAIFHAIKGINQKKAAPVDVPPNQPVPATSVTLIDGVPKHQPVSSVSSRDLAKRQFAGYQEAFSGSGTGPTDRDASIQGTAYLTYTVVSNATYDVADCLNHCDSVASCVFANLYYEFNNELLDFVFSEHSNLKCALYGDVHTAAEKTNFGGQQSYPSPGPLTYIQDSSGWAAVSLLDPPAPTGYSLVYGPTGGANNAPGYMGFAFLDRYDVDACAELCNTRGADPTGGPCRYFNIWRAVVGGTPTTYTCSMYYLVADPSTAVNTGQGDLVVTYARGYSRQI